jgi:hypothetical protein
MELKLVLLSGQCYWQLILYAIANGGGAGDPMAYYVSAAIGVGEDCQDLPINLPKTLEPANPCVGNLATPITLELPP